MQQGEPNSLYRVVILCSSVGRMAGAGGNKKARIKVKRFKPEWLDQTIEGSKASLWLKPDVFTPGGRSAPCVQPRATSRSMRAGRP